VARYRRSTSGKQLGGLRLLIGGDRPHERASGCGHGDPEIAVAGKAVQTVQLGR
jgi:hypothetical protein